MANRDLLFVLMPTYRKIRQLCLYLTLQVYTYYKITSSHYTKLQVYIYTNIAASSDLPIKQQIYSIR